jgi:hypothetical protein
MRDEDTEAITLLSFNGFFSTTYKTTNMTNISDVSN